MDTRAIEASAEARSLDSGSEPSSMISASVSDAAWNFFVEREETRESRPLGSNSLAD